MLTDAEWNALINHISGRLVEMELISYEELANILIEAKVVENVQDKQEYRLPRGAKGSVGETVVRPANPREAFVVLLEMLESKLQAPALIDRTSTLLERRDEEIRWAPDRGDLFADNRGDLFDDDRYDRLYVPDLMQREVEVFRGSDLNVSNEERRDIISSLRELRSLFEHS
jgi:hypothetical protein